MSLLSIFKNPGSSVSQRQKTGWIGIDIGTATIKLAQLERCGGRLHIARSLTIRADDNNNNNPFDLQSFSSGRVGEAIRKALQVHGGFRGRDTACLVSMNHCQLRTLVSAKGTEDEQRELISLEIENDHHASTVPQEFEFWDASNGEHHEPRGMTQLHVLSMPRTLSDAVANSLLHAKLQCHVLDAVPFATIRASEMATSFSTATIAAASYTVLDWGHSVATLTVVHLGQPFIARALKHCGMQRIVHGVRQKLKLSAAEAEAILATYGVSATLHGAGMQTELQSLLTNVTAGATRDLVEEIHETLSFMKMQFPEQMPAHLYMVGGGAAIRNMDLLLQQQLGLPVYKWSLRGSPSESVSPVFATAAALSALAWEL